MFVAVWGSAVGPLGLAWARLDSALDGDDERGARVGCNCAVATTG